MPNIKSAKKRVKVIATKTARNKATKSALRTAVKKAYYAVDTNADIITTAVFSLSTSITGDDEFFRRCSPNRHCFKWKSCNFNSECAQLTKA